MYATPFSTVFNVWNTCSSKANITKSLADLQEQFVSHPFTTASSLEYRKLEYLSKLIAEWMRVNGLDSDMPAMVHGRQEDSSLLNNLFYIMTAGYKPTSLIQVQSIYFMCILLN